MKIRGRVQHGLPKAPPGLAGWGVAVCLALAAPATVLRAQIVGDDTLTGRATDFSAGRPDYIINATAGRQVGPNLFHSFRQFDLSRGESATFQALPESPVSNLLVRVTGGRSQIDGAVVVQIPGANLYFLNPAGVVFGPDAQVDVPGSLAVSTADYLRLADGGTFHATDPAQSVLTSAPPAAFGFLAREPSSAPPPMVDIQGSASAPIRVPEGRELSVIAGAARIQNRALIAGAAGRVRLITQTSPGEVTSDDGSSSSGAPVPSQAAGGSITLNGATLSAINGGSVVVRGAPVQLEDSQIIIATDQPASAGVLEVVSVGDVTLRRSRLDASTSGDGDGGSIRLIGRSIAIAGGIRGLVDQTVGAVVASNGITTAGARGSGRGGSILLQSDGPLTLTEGALVTAQVGADADGANVDVIAAGTVRIDPLGREGATGFTAETIERTDGLETFGNAGRVSLTAPALEIHDRGRIATSTATAGNAGNIIIDVGRLRIDGQDAARLTGVEARVGDQEVETRATGRGGTIFLDADTIDLDRGGVVTATTFTLGDGGRLQVRAEDVSITGSQRSEFTGLFARTTLPPESGTGGRGGDIDLQARTLRIDGPGAVAATSTSANRAGNVLARARELHLSDGGLIAVDATTSDGGNVAITGARHIVISGRSRIAANAGRDGGNIDLVASELVYLDDRSLITGQAGRDGGRITIDPPVVVLARGSQINGLSGGAPVPVTIDASALLVSFGDSGILTDAPFFAVDTDVTSDLVALRNALQSVAAQLQQACADRITGSFSSFVQIGRQGLPLLPGAWMPALAIDGANDSPAATDQ